MPRFLLFLLVTCVVLAAPLLILRSPANLLSFVHWGFDTFTELQLEIKNPIINLGEGVLRADEVHLVPRGQAGPALFSIVDLDISTRLSNLISGKLKDTLVSASYSVARSSLAMSTDAAYRLNEIVSLDACAA